MFRWMIIELLVEFSLLLWDKFLQSSPGPNTTLHDLKMLSCWLWKLHSMLDVVWLNSVLTNSSIRSVKNNLIKLLCDKTDLNVNTFSTNSFHDVDGWLYKSLSLHCSCRKDSSSFLVHSLTSYFNDWDNSLVSNSAPMNKCLNCKYAWIVVGIYNFITSYIACCSCKGCIDGTCATVGSIYSVENIRAPMTGS